MDEETFLKSDACYAINPIQFHIVSRNAQIVSYSADRINHGAGEVVKVFLGMVGDEFRTVREEISESRSLLSLSVEMAKTKIEILVQGGSGKFNLGEYAQALSSENAEVLVKIDTRSDGMFAIQLRKVTARIQQTMLETIVQERYGATACRIWRLLKIKLKLDDKQVAKFALMDDKVSRKYLYGMLKGGLVFMQDVPKDSYHSAAKTIFLWYVDPARSIQILVQDIYKSIDRLRERREREVKKREGLLLKASRSDILSGQAQLSEQEREQLKQLDTTLMMIDVQISRIDEMLMILHVF